LINKSKLDKELVQNVVRLLELMMSRHFISVIDLFPPKEL